MKKLCTFLIIICAIMLLTACSQPKWNEVWVGKGEITQVKIQPYFNLA